MEDQNTAALYASLRELNRVLKEVMSRAREIGMKITIIIHVADHHPIVRTTTPTEFPE